MLEKLDGAETLLLTAIEDLRRSGDAGQLAQSEGQLALLAKLRDQVGKADPAALSQLRTAVVAMVATTQNTASESCTAGSAAQQVQAHELAMLATESRAQVMALTRDLRQFDGGLRFASPSEEDEYREREAERRSYIADQQAKHTPQADLNAAGGALGQLIDAKAHSPGPTPVLDERLRALMATTEKLREAAKANGVPTDEFDRRLRDDLHRIMKSKGLSDAEITARFAATPDPMEAAKAYVRSEDEFRSVQQSAKEASASKNATVAASPQADDHSIGDAIAKLQMAGVTTNRQPSGEAFAHGVTVTLPAASVDGRDV